MGNKLKSLWFLAAMPIIASAGSQARAADIDFEGLSAGDIVNQVSTGAGISGNINGSVGVFGFNPTLAGNQAMVYDSSCPPGGNSSNCSGGDFDLGTPNEMFGGPGVGIAGETTNDTALGNILIISEDGDSSDPDDADVPGAFIELDFTTVKGSVTFNAITMMDVELPEFAGNNLIIERKNKPQVFFSIPPAGDNGVVTLAGIDVTDATKATVNLNGSGAIASVIFEEAELDICWITTGGFQNAGIQAGMKTCTFGGNVGPPPSGAWQVIDHTTGDNFHTNDVDITLCTTIDKTGPGQPGGKKGLTINKAFFAGTGRLNNVAGFDFTGFVVDAGEPSGKKSNDKDEFSLVATDSGGAVVFDCTGELDGGNVQIHPGNPSLN